MCTVTFIPYKDTVFITSNRDEQTLREPALAPAAYPFKTGNIFFPKDGRAGGTWIAMHSNGNTMVLLNGAFEKHKHQPPYRKSRGLIFLEILDSEDPVTQFDAIDLDDIEPFTLALWANKELHDLRWDGTKKYRQRKDATVPHIWSSAMLYDKAVIEKREHWFYEWLRGRESFTAEDIRKFHEFGGEGDKRTGLMMNLDGILQTVSITGMELSPGNASMYYRDTITNEVAVHKCHP